MANLKKWIEANQIIHGQFYDFRMYDSVASDDQQKEIDRIRQEVYEQEITAVSAVGVHLDQRRRCGVGRRRLWSTRNRGASGCDAPHQSSPAAPSGRCCAQYRRGQGSHRRERP